MNRASYSLLLLAAAFLGGIVARWAVPATAAAQTADSGPRYVAATGNYQEGVALLYVLDQKTEHLAVYQARGGAPNSREVVFVGARNISLDTLLPAYNDDSEYSYQELLREFDKRQILGPGEDGQEGDD